MTNTYKSLLINLTSLSLNLCHCLIDVSSPICLSRVADLFPRSIVTAEVSYMRSLLVKMALQFSQNWALAPSPQGRKSWGNLSIQLSNSVHWESCIGLSSAPLRYPLHTYFSFTGTQAPTEQARLEACLTEGSHCAWAAGTDNIGGGGGALWTGGPGYLPSLYPPQPLPHKLHWLILRLIHSLWKPSVWRQK